MAGALMISCSQPDIADEKQDPILKKYQIDREQSIEQIGDAYDRYNNYKEHKAMAVAIDKVGRYVLGYSYGTASRQSAKRIALSKCRHLLYSVEIKPKATCKIYAVDDEIVTHL